MHKSSPQRWLLVLAAAAAAGCAGPPERDVFLPPYAEKGCWARLYEKAHFAGAVRQLEGPIFVEALDAAPVVVPALEQTAPQPLFSEIGSLRVGPHARIVGYAAPLFRTPALELAPGTSLADLTASPFHERFASFTLACEA